MPTDRRSRSARRRACPAPSTLARCSTRLSTPPSEVARFHSSTRAAVAIGRGLAARRRGSTACRRSRPASGAPRRRGPGAAGRPGIEHRRDMLVCARSARRGAARCAAARDAQEERAHAAQQQPGLERAEDRAGCAREHLITRFQKSSSARVTSAPAITSEWPFRYLVAECITMSAPSSIGRVSTGVATVESTASRRAGACAIAAVGGDVGDVPGRIRRRLDPDQPRLAGTQPPPRRAAGSVMSTSSTCEPQCVAKLMQPVAQRPVHDLRREHVIARRQRLEHGRRRGHARGEPARPAPPSRRASSASAWPKRRVVGARIDAAGAVLVVGVAHVGRRRCGSAARSRLVASMQPSAWAARVSGWSGGLGWRWWVMASPTVRQAHAGGTEARRGWGRLSFVNNRLGASVSFPREAPIDPDGPKAAAVARIVRCGVLCRYVPKDTEQWPSGLQRNGRPIRGAASRSGRCPDIPTRRRWPPSRRKLHELSAAGFRRRGARAEGAAGQASPRARPSCCRAATAPRASPSSTPNNIRDTFKVLLQMAVVLTYGGRPAGGEGRPHGRPVRQAALGRHRDDRAASTLPSYRGDIINGIEFDAAARTPDPQRMLQALSASRRRRSTCCAPSRRAAMPTCTTSTAGTLGFVARSPPARALPRARRPHRPRRSTSWRPAGSPPRRRRRSARPSSSPARGAAAALRAGDDAHRFDRPATGTTARRTCCGSATARASPTARMSSSCAASSNPIGLKCGPTTEPDELLRLIDMLNPEQRAGPPDPDRAHGRRQGRGEAAAR